MNATTHRRTQVEGPVGEIVRTIRDGQPHDCLIIYPALRPQGETVGDLYSLSYQGEIFHVAIYVGGEPYCHCEIARRYEGPSHCVHANEVADWFKRKRSS